MIDALSRNQRRVLALAILALILALLFMFTVMPLWAVNRHYLETIDDLDARLQILQRAASAGSGLQTQHDQLKRALAANRQYLKASSEALAAANLQSVVKRVAATSGMEVLSTQILPSSEESGLNRVSLKVRMRGDLDDTVKAFHALETGQPYLFLDNLSIRSHTRRTYKNTPGQKLNVDFDLIGYMQQPS